jgi:ribosomal protein S18 acetylase RimI-like enzyme
MIYIKEIKEFTPEDFQAVKALLEELLEDAPALDEARFRAIVTSENAHLFVASPDGETIAGMATLGIYETPSGKKAWLEDVVTTFACRGKGYGKRLVQHAIEFAQWAGANTLMLTSRPSREAANQLYRGLGFLTKQTNVYKKELNKPIVGANNPNIGANKPNAVDQKPIIGANKSNICANKPNVVDQKPIIGANKPIIGANKPNMVDQKPIIGATKPNVVDHNSNIGDRNSIINIKNN